MATLQQMRERIKELELFIYRKQQRRSPHDSDADVQGAINWATERIAAIRNDMKQAGGK